MILSWYCHQIMFVEWGLAIYALPRMQHQAFVGCGCLLFHPLLNFLWYCEFDAVLKQNKQNPFVFLLMPNVFNEELWMNNNAGSRITIGYYWNIDLDTYKLHANLQPMDISQPFIPKSKDPRILLKFIKLYQLISGLFLANMLFSLSCHLLFLHAQGKFKAFCS